MVAQARVVNRGSVELYLGMLARLMAREDDAISHLERAIASHERLRAPLLIARTQIELSRALTMRAGPGDAERARVLLDEATERGNRHGSLLLMRLVSSPA